MAKQTGIIKLKGTIGGISFYKTSDGHLAREKGVLKHQELQMILRFKEHVKTVLNLELLVKVVKYFEMRFVFCCKMQKTNVW